MKILSLSIIALSSGLLFSQKDSIQFSDVQRKRILYSSGSAFVKYSNFQPRNVEEILIMLQGNSDFDSILLNRNIDSLLVNSDLIYDNLIRKDFGLETIHSPTTQYFVKHKMYAPRVMKSFIVLIYYYFLKEEPFVIRSIRKKALKNKKILNQKDKRKLRSQIKSYQKSY